jgi:hypothetical protein
MKKPSHKKNTLLQAAQGNAETKACKRVFFSATQENFFPSLLFLLNLFFQRTGFVRNRTDTASNVNRFGQSVNKLDTTHLRTDRRATDNKGLKEMAGDVVNRTAVLSTKCCAWRQVSASKPPLR